tara:strand:- start:144 stop:563 length:420 start_codon:yes stop_codon:yes gene_type:complete
MTVLQAKFHHIGIVVQSIEKYIQQSIYKEAYREKYESIIYDPLQDSNFLLIKTDQSIFIELIQPISEVATTYNYLKKSGKSSIFHHVCYEVPSKNFADQLCTDFGIKIFWGPNPAKLFLGREIMFGYNRNQEIIEFLFN